MHNITVVNKKAGGKGEYIGRPSPLGNPFTSKAHGMGKRVDTVQESIAQFDAWLQAKIADRDQAVCDELDRLYVLAQQRPLQLVCWCAPGPCHGDVIKRVLEEAHSRLRP